MNKYIHYKHQLDMLTNILLTKTNRKQVFQHGINLNISKKPRSVIW